MSDDIVNKLQTLCHPASEFLPGGKRLTLFIQHSKEAADEIDRLRGEVEALSHALDDANKSRGLALDEVERLTRERDYWARARNEWEKSAGLLEEENKRLTRELAYMTVQRDQWRGTCASHASRAEAAERELSAHMETCVTQQICIDKIIKDRDAAKAKVAKLREALTPFVEAYENTIACDDDKWRDKDSLWESAAAMALCAGDLRRARAALNETETKGE